MGLVDQDPSSSMNPNPPPSSGDIMNPFIPTNASVTTRPNSKLRSNSKRRRNDTETLVHEAEQLLESVIDPNIAGVLSKMLDMLKTLSDGMATLLQQSQDFPQFKGPNKNNSNQS